MSRLLFVKLVLIIGIVFAAGTSSWSDARFARGEQQTLVAASSSARDAGIKTYKVRAAVGTGSVTAELLDEGHTVLGNVVERRDQTGRLLFSSITLKGRSLAVSYAPGDVKIEGDGVVLYEGPFQKQSDASTASVMAMYGDLMATLAAVTDDIRSVVKTLEEIAERSDRVAEVPAVFRPIASFAIKLLGSQALHAASDEEEIYCTFPDSERRYCEFNFDEQRSVACFDAKQESNLDCWNSACIGCCAWDDEDCDCGCVWGDFICECLACGYACDFLLE